MTVVLGDDLLKVSPHLMGGFELTDASERKNGVSSQGMDAVFDQPGRCPVRISLPAQLQLQLGWRGRACRLGVRR